VNAKDVQDERDEKITDDFFSRYLIIFSTQFAHEVH